MSQDYNNLRVTAFNRNVEELGKRTADLSESRSESFFFFAGAEQKELLAKSQREAEETETTLLAEFASERSSWTDKEAMLASGFHEIEDLVDGELLCFSFRAADYRSSRLLVF